MLMLTVTEDEFNVVQMLKFSTKGTPPHADVAQLQRGLFFWKYEVVDDQ